MVCDDGKGNLETLNVTEIEYYQKENYAVASGLGNDRQGDGLGAMPQLKGHCKISLNQNFNSASE